MCTKKSTWVIKGCLFTWPFAFHTVPIRAMKWPLGEPDHLCSHCPPFPAAELSSGWHLESLLPTHAPSSVLMCGQDKGQPSFHLCRGVQSHTEQASEETIWVAEEASGRSEQAGPCRQRSLSGRVGTRAQSRKMGRTERLEGRNWVFQVRERGNRGKRTEASGTAHNSLEHQRTIHGEDVCGMPWVSWPEVRDQKLGFRNQSLEFQAQSHSPELSLEQNCLLGWCKMLSWAPYSRGMSVLGHKMDSCDWLGPGNARPGVGPEPD